MLPTLAPGTSKRGKKNREAAARVKAKFAAEAAGEPVPTPTVDRSRFAPIPIDEAPKRKRKPGEVKLPAQLRDGTQLHLPHGAKFIQERNLPPSSVPGQAAIEALLSRRGATQPTNVFVPGVDLQYEDDGEHEVRLELHDPYTQGSSRHRRRRLKQHQNWNDLVSTDIMEEYLRQKHTQLDAPGRQTDGTACGCTRRTLTVTLVDWDANTVIEISVCACRSACKELLARGYFPCAPISPSLGFNTSLLDFIAIHSLNVAPNVTAWSDTLETFWARRGLPSRHHGRLRKRLAMALTWYQVLDNRAEAMVNASIDSFVPPKRAAEKDADALSQRPKKQARLREHDPQVSDARAHGETAGPSSASHSHASPTRPSSRRARVDDWPEEESAQPARESPEDDAHGETAGPSSASHSHASPTRPSSRRARVDDWPEEESAEPAAAAPTQDRAQRLLRPSLNLRRKCPMCFGGERAQLQHTEADVIVCLDANFSQKRRKCADSDPPLEYIDGQFLARSSVDAMESELAERRKGKPRRRTRGTSARVAEEVLDECEASFLAAQEKVAKASTNYYADTGLMALLCRHDRVLWVTNMTTPGERQHFALALLRKLAEELPDDWRLGVLYDIACQLSRSIEKWGLLPELSDRVSFAVSVFHAYGHQWACQVIFHPRKRDGFGLTDGEGCERFWSAIRHLIAGLRVSGHYRRIFVLDRQIEAMNSNARWNFAIWLRRRYGDAIRRKLVAQRVLAGCGVSEDVLAKEWKAQVEAQVKKPPRQSAHAADKVIDNILLAMGTVDDLKQELRDVKKALRRVHKMTTLETQELTTRVDAIQREMEAERARIVTLNASLGTEQCRRLETMRGNAYLRARVNARALRATIRHALQAHKFERRKLERAYRNQVMHAKDHAQTKDLVHRREKTISSQVKKYNALVDQMALLARQGKKPSARTCLPRRLDMKKLFRLDVDDEIWQEDPGLGPQEEATIARWQTDANVKKGILALLELRRCVEEMERVEAEVRALLRWWGEEEGLLCRAVKAASLSDGVGAAVERRQLTHQRLHDIWQGDLVASLLSVHFRAGGVAAALDKQHYDSQLLAQEEGPELTAEADVDSDDASDAYSSAEDEDEPLAEMMDELEGAAADLDDDDEEQAEHVESAGVAGARDDQELDAAPSKREEAAVDARRLDAPSGEGIGSERRSSVIPVADAGVIEVSSDNEDERRSRVGSGVKTKNFRVGGFFCDDLDVARITKRTGWLSGQGLAVFVRGELQKRGLDDISIVHPRMLLDVEMYGRAVVDGEGSVEGCRAAIVAGLSELVHPDRARKWLVLGHVQSPPHWTLLEIRFKEGKIFFYDSFARIGGYAATLESSVRQFLMLCKELLQVELDVPGMHWIAEQREARQTNAWDCGPFVAADACSLMDGDEPSTLTQKDMGRWRQTMEDGIRALEFVPTKPRGTPRDD